MFLGLLNKFNDAKVICFFYTNKIYIILMFLLTKW